MSKMCSVSTRPCALLRSGSTPTRRRNRIRVSESLPCFVFMFLFCFCFCFCCSTNSLFKYSIFFKCCFNCAIKKHKKIQWKWQGVGSVPFLSCKRNATYRMWKSLNYFTFSRIFYSISLFAGSLTSISIASTASTTPLSRPQSMSEFVRV